MIFHENRLPVDDSHEYHALFVIFEKENQNFKLSSAANYRWHFKVKSVTLTEGPESITRK